jgi:flavodoxin short chain
MKKSKIVYVSMTGNTEEIANLTKDELTKNGLEAEVFEATEISPADLQDADVIVLASYTYGMGELPDEINDFYNEIPNQDFSGKTYGVIGSGDKSYDDLFCEAVKLLDEQIAKTGAKKGAENVQIEFAPDSDEDFEKIKNFAKSLSA